MSLLLPAMLGRNAHRHVCLLLYRHVYVYMYTKKVHREALQATHIISDYCQDIPRHDREVKRNKKKKENNIRTPQYTADNIHVCITGRKQASFSSSVDQVKEP